MDFEWLTAAFQAEREDGFVIDRNHPQWDQFEWERLLLEDPDELTRRLEELDGPAPELPQRPKAVGLPPVALAVSRDQAAELLSMSVDHFERHVLPDLRVAQVGRRRLVPVRELERYLSEKSARALKGPR